MKILIVSLSDFNGGAFIAARRLHSELRKFGYDSIFLSCYSSSITSKNKNYPDVFSKILLKLRSKICDQILKLQKSTNPVLHSLSLFSNYSLVRIINSSDADIVNLHWVQREMLSVKDLIKIRKPIVWTLHDMWAFCGAEHYVDNLRWKDGYNKSNRPIHDFGLDINRWTWLRKKKVWKKKFQIVTPSKWLAYCVKQSHLLKGWPVEVIGNPISSNDYYPLSKSVSKKNLGLSNDLPVITFGAVDSTNDPRKGFDLLIESLNILCKPDQHPKFQILIFGNNGTKYFNNLNIPVFLTGHISSDSALREIYNSSDVFVIPSRIDNLPNTGVEAQLCGVPVVAFNVGGLSDIIRHKYNGYLAQPFDSNDLAKGIKLIIENEDKINFFNNSLQYSKRFHPGNVIHKYLSTFETVCNKEE